MQGRVSIVIPCYNKEKYIGAMLDSVIAQKWDNIELILVNDGSTDGTLDVINSYLPKFYKRGFEVKLIDQENGGACNAVYNGLLQISGDYLALIDADDELDSGYISTMAGWLEEHDDCDYCSCDFLIRRETGIEPFVSHPMYMNGQYSLELFLARNVNKAAWNFLVRTSYFKRCKIIENYVGLGQCSYEPGFCIPLAAYGGKMKSFNVPLYIYNTGIDGMSRQTDIKRYQNYLYDYYKITQKVLTTLPIEIMDKYKYSYYSSIAYFQKLRLLYDLSWAINDGARTRNDIFDEFLEFIVRWLGIEFSSDVYGKETLLFLALESKLVKMSALFNGKQRIIGYGALGKNAINILPKFEGSKYYPTELWDKNGDGSRIKKPDFESLTENDVIFVFPSNKDAVSEIREQLKGCPAKVYYRNEIDYFLAEIEFPQISNFERM